MVLFKVDKKGKITSHFLRELGLGSGDIKKMAINKTKTVKFKHKGALQNLIDHYYYVSYDGSSLFADSCSGATPNIKYFLITETITISQ